MRRRTAMNRCLIKPRPTPHRGTTQDVEKAAAKVGVVLQSVKEVLLGMVADDLVHEDRIGASKYYWAFPSEHATKVRAGQADAVRAPAGRWHIGRHTDMLHTSPHSLNLAACCLG